MPHVIVKFYPGQSEADKKAMADGVAKALHDTMGYDVRYVSVAVEEIDKSDWMSTVYAHDISGQVDHLVKVPEYGPLSL